MRQPRQPSRAERGTTLVEAIVAMGVLLVAGLALASMQVTSFRTARFGDRMVQASSLATDLANSMALWEYDDTRLAAQGNKTSFSDSSISWSLSSTPHYSDADLAPSGTTYTGLSNDVDRDGTADFHRYWNVYTINPTGAGSEDGKMIQIFVRWRDATENGTGLWHQVTVLSYRRNPARIF